MLPLIRGSNPIDLGSKVKVKVKLGKLFNLLPGGGGVFVPFRTGFMFGLLLQGA